MSGTQILTPAASYDFVEDLCILTCYFNPNRYKSKKTNFDRFIRPIKESGLSYFIIECAFDGTNYELPASDNVIRVRSNAILWQKERLINVGLKQLPPRLSKFVWLDSDILFCNPAWAKETSVHLDSYPVIQPYDRAIRLPKNNVNFSGDGLVYNGFGAIYNRYPNVMVKGDFELHGHTGFAWAGQTEVFREDGLYDACLSGGADHLMAHAFCGDWHSKCLKRVFLDNHTYFSHFENWSRKMYAKVKGRVGYTAGTIMHLWHGNHSNRRYTENSAFLNETSFDPVNDLLINETGCWEIRADKKSLMNWTVDYIAERKED